MGFIRKNVIVRSLLCLVITAVIGFGVFYATLPALNLQSADFYTFAFTLLIIYTVLTFIFSIGLKQYDYVAYVKKNAKIPLIIAGALVIVIIGGVVTSMEIFRSQSYRNLMPIQTGSFEDEITQTDFENIPMLDKDSAEKLGNRKLGELSDMVSQFEVINDYTQINYKGRPVRVTTLAYGDIIKWLNNRKEGIPAYMIIDMVTQNVEVVRLDEGIKYSESEHFSRLLDRHLRFNYPTFMFESPTFEIDEQGNPYWICPRVVKTIGLFGGKDIKGAVLVNAVTGENKYYEVVPDWVDRVYKAELITQQYDYYGNYINGFFNSIFGQKGVTQATRGYNYMALGDDVYMYTGVTSVVSDESNVGFLLVNQRTKEAKYYACAGAEEYSAMTSAEGVVQHLKYTATFPLLLNVDGEPTYFMALKDNGNLVKQYAMVNVRQYQIVATGTTVNECKNNYLKLLSDSNILKPEQTPNDNITGVIDEIRSAIIGGNTYYYIKLQDNSVYYAISADKDQNVVLLNVGDSVDINYNPSESAIVSVNTITKK